MASKGKPAAVMGSLVNLKNVGSHKCISLTIHVPAEAATAVLAAFGWPTMVDPVPVAVARLEESASLTQPQREGMPQGVAGWDETSTDANRRQVAEPEPPTRLRHWPELSPAQQTGVIRNEVDFWDFAGVDDAELARDYIRGVCGVTSCAEILPGTEAAAKWAQLQVRYGNWLRRRRGAA